MHLLGVRHILSGNLKLLYIFFSKRTNLPFSFSSPFSLLCLVISILRSTESCLPMKLEIEYIFYVGTLENNILTNQRAC